MRVLKKILLWLLLVAVLAALIVGGAVAWFYYNTDPRSIRRSCRYRGRHGAGRQRL